MSELSGLRIGTSGFSFADWVGPVYPAGLPKTKMLEYYESVLGFDAVELNFTYYTMPVARTLEAMLRRTGKGFSFVVRTHKEMTHEIWQDEKRTVLKDTAAAFAQFREGIRPLVESTRLGCVLVQLPVYFVPTPQNVDYLRQMPERLPGVRLVVEFRNRAWLRAESFRLLEECGLGYCVVDEPKLARLVPFEPRRTSGIAYFRFHGRNRNWFRASREERYDYLYTLAELEEFIAPVRAVSAGAEATFLFFNNCHAGSAARNALLMKQMLGLVAKLSSEQQRIVDGRTEDGLLDTAG
ncbi:MAG: DUF72 domain-containing protein [candidate division WOR-3 bacterium]